uniref:Uncharacterized protein n=1 Tax=Rhizophora mucronata TaxID=61149 RepID=A0A2P2MYL1_RHIMU
MTFFNIVRISHPIRDIRAYIRKGLHPSSPGRGQNVSYGNWSKLRIDPSSSRPTILLLSYTCPKRHGKKRVHFTHSPLLMYDELYLM